MTETKSENAINVVTPAGRLLWPKLLTPDTQGQYADNKYKTSLLVDPAASPNVEPSLNSFKKQLAAVARAHFGAQVDLKTIIFPVKNGTALAEKGKGEHFRDMVVIRCKGTQYKPRVLHRTPQGDVDVIDENVIYPGSVVHISGTMKAFDGNGSNVPPSVVFYPSMVLKVGDADRLGGADPEKVFAGIAGATVEKADFSDEIPF